MKHGIRFFSLLRLVWRARRPSLITDMQALPGGFWMRRGYDAFTFFGTILVHNVKEAETMNQRFTALKNHELIHLRQAQSTGDSWWRFYRLYLRYWFQGWRQRKHYPGAAYRLNPFEMEAYEHMDDLGYLSQCKDGATEWKRFAAMSIDERHKYKRYRLTK